MTGTHLQLVCLLAIYARSESACTRASPVDLGILVHSSDAELSGSFIAMKRFLLSLVDQFRLGPGQSRLGLIVYGERPHLCFTLREASRVDAVSLKFKLLAVNAPRGRARTDRALALAGATLFTADGGDRPGVPNVLLVMMDGRAAPGSEPYRRALKLLKAREVRIVAVGIGRGVDAHELLQIAMGQRRNVVHVDGADGLDRRLAAITDKTC